MYFKVSKRWIFLLLPEALCTLRPYGNSFLAARAIFQLMRDVSSGHLQKAAAHCDLCANFFKKIPKVHVFKDASTNCKRLKLKELKREKKNLWLNLWKTSCHSVLEQRSLWS